MYYLVVDISTGCRVLVLELSVQRIITNGAVLIEISREFLLAWNYSKQLICSWRVIVCGVGS